MDIANEIANTMERLKRLQQEDWQDPTDEVCKELWKRFNSTAKPRFQYSDDWLAIAARESQTWEYYMGFEYLDKDDKVQFGDLILFSTCADRVKEIISIIEDFPTE